MSAQDEEKIGELLTCFNEKITSLLNKKDEVITQLKKENNKLKETIEELMKKDAVTKKVQEDDKLKEPIEEIVKDDGTPLNNKDIYEIYMTLKKISNNNVIEIENLKKTNNDLKDKSSELAKRINTLEEINESSYTVRSVLENPNFMQKQNNVRNKT